MIVKKYMGKAVRRIVKDFKQKELMPLKISFFVQATTIAVLYPYLTIHMRELGINVEETAIMSALVPVIGLVMPPLAGMVADKIGNFKILLSSFSLIGGLAALLLLLVPPARIKVPHPNDLVLDFGCSDNGYATMRLADNYPCHTLPTNKTKGDIHLRFESCGLACQATNRSHGIERFLDDTLNQILNARSYSIRTDSGNVTRSVIYNVTDAVNATDGVRRVADDFYYFPASSYSLRCSRADDVTRCVIGDGEDVPSSSPSTGEPTQEDWYRDRGVVAVLGPGDGGVVPLTNATCATKRDVIITVTVYPHADESNHRDTIELSRCELRCLMLTRRNDTCDKPFEEIEYDPTFTFWVYLVVRVLIGIIGSTSYAMYEVAVIAILREQKADYGLQRIYSSIGGMVASPLAGFLIDYASEGKLQADFSPAFYLYAALKILCALLMLLINLEFKKPAETVIADFLRVVRNVEVILLLACCFVMGAAWGYIESFLFWFLQDLGGNSWLMGITVTVGGVAGIPLLILSGPIIDRIGHANVLVIGCIFYGIRLLGYSLIYNPYYCLFFEAMESITASLSFTAAITYAAKLSTTTTDGSIQGLVGGLYFGVGRGAGTLVGGYLMNAYGTRRTYRIFAMFIVAVGLIYFFINLFYIRKLPNRSDNEICKKEPKREKSKEAEAAASAVAAVAMTETEPRDKPQDGSEKKPEMKERATDVESQKEMKNEGYVPDGDETESTPKGE